MKLIKLLKKLFTLPHQCKVCGKAFDTRKGLNIHIGKVHKEKRKEFKQ